MPNMLNSITNIPGMMLEFKDGGLQLRETATQEATTRSVLLIGTAQDGPIMEPVAVDATSAELVFGKGVNQAGRPNGATLPEAFTQMYKGGCRDIRMMRVSGAVATSAINGVASEVPSVLIKRETLGTVGGNDQQTFVLSHKKIDTSSVSVRSAGTPLLSTRFTANHEAGTVTMLANSTSVGSPLAITYNYYPDVTLVTDELPTVTDGATFVTLAHTPLTETDGVADPVVTVNDLVVTYTVDSTNHKKIVLNDAEPETVTDEQTTIADGAQTVEFGADKAVVADSLTNVKVGNTAKVLDTDYTVDYDTSVITFLPVQNDVTDETFTPALDDTTITLAHTPVAGSIVVEVDAVAKVEDVDFTVNNNEILFANPFAGTETVTVDYTWESDQLANGNIVHVDYEYNVNTLADTDVVKVTYRYASGTPVTVTENSTDDVEWVATTAANQEFTLAETPVTGSTRLYIDSREVLDTSFYTINSELKKIGIDKAKFTLAQTVEVAYNYQEVSEDVPTVELETYFGGRTYNETTFEVTATYASDNVTVIDKTIKITKPLAKRSNSNELPREYKASIYPTLASLVNAINNDANNGVVRASTEFGTVETITIPVTARTSFANGDDGLSITKQQLFEKLSGRRDATGAIVEYGAYQILQNYRADAVIPVGVYADDELVGKYDSFAYELALFCAVASQTHLTHGYIQMKPPVKTDLASLEAYVQKLESYSNLYFMRTQDGSFVTDSDGQPFDLGGYMSVIAGPEVTFTSERLGLYTDVATFPYAGLMATLRASSAPTNKVLPAISGMRYNFSVAQLDRLGGKRYVTFQRRVSDQAIVTTDGVTAARAGSDYSRIVNINAVRDCIKAVHIIAEPYIGEPMSSTNNNALSSAISKKLTELSDTQSGIIETYSFNLVSNPLDKLIGDSKIELTIVPLGERRRITVVVGLRPSL